MRLKGFTLIELLIVMSIIGVLAGLVAGGFRTAQLRARDAQRKSDLKQISEGLELYFSDHNQYPDASGGKIVSCGSGTSVCDWGDEFTDGNTVYVKSLPIDPNPSQDYLYRLVGSNNQSFQVFAHLENTKDPDIITLTHVCGSEECNFGASSANTTPLE